MTFTMWTPLHYFMMISPFIIAFVLYLLFDKRNDEVKRMVGILLTIVAIILLIARNIEIFILRGYHFDYELVPLQVCHFANFVLLYAYITRNDSVFGFALLFNLPLAYLSLVFADGLENYTNILTWRGQAYIWGHILIVAITFYGYLVGFIRLNIRKVFNITIIINVLVLSSVFVNTLFRVLFNQNANYFYSIHPELGTPLEVLYSWGNVIIIGNFEINIIYVLLLAIAGPLMMFIFYLVVFELPNRIKKCELI